jgi:hypothetical protein
MCDGGARTHGMNWLVQKNWENVSLSCTMGAPR